jgi:hypothetical protein
MEVVYCGLLVWEHDVISEMKVRKEQVLCWPVWVSVFLFLNPLVTVMLDPQDSLPP